MLGVLIALTCVSCVVLLGLGWRSVNGFEVAIARALRQASAYTAREAAEQVKRDLKAPVFNLLGKIDHSAIRSFHSETIAATVGSLVNDFPMIDAFFVWSPSVDGPIHDEEEEGAGRRVLFFPFSSMRSAPDRVPADGDVGSSGFFEDPSLSRMLQAEARELARMGRNFGLSHLLLDGHRYHVVYHFLYDERARHILQGVEGFLADANYIQATYFAEVLAALQREGPDTELSRLAVSILDDQNREIFRTGRSLQDQYEAQAHFPFLFFDVDLIDSLSPHRPQVPYWTVRTGYEGGDIATMVYGESLHQRWTWLIVGMMAVVGIALAARAAAHELRLAQMKSEFVASISHDLKTPLSKIQLFADTLAAGRASTPEKASGYYRVIGAQARKLAHLIGELLDFSEIEAGVRKYSFKELDLRAVLRSALGMYDCELSEDQYAVDLVFPDADVPVLANGEALQQVFAGILNNAVKYSSAERFLRVALWSQNGWALVEVTDRGIGIPRHEQRKIFDKFYRGADALAIVPNGSGIGLTIVDHVVRAHGGTVSVRSEPGKGSTFTVSLPLLAEATEVEGGEAHPGY